MKRALITYTKKCAGCQVIRAPDFASQGSGLNPFWRWNSAHDCLAGGGILLMTVWLEVEFCSWLFGWRWNSSHDCLVLCCTEHFIIIIRSSRYDLNNVERDVKTKSSSSHIQATKSQISCTFVSLNLMEWNQHANPSPLWAYIIKYILKWLIWKMKIQLTLFIWKSQGLSEILWDIPYLDISDLQKWRKI